MEKAEPAPVGVGKPRRRALTQFLRRAAPFLLFGVVATVGVAWSVQWWPSSSRTWTREVDHQWWEARHSFHVEIPKAWPAWIPDDWPAPSVSHGYWDAGLRSFGYGARDTDHLFPESGKIVPPYQPGDTMYYSFGRTELGWPLRSLCSSGGTRYIFTGRNYPDYELRNRPGIIGVLDRGLRIERPGKGRFNDWWFPIRPMLVGFIVDVLFYALLAWLPFGVFFGVRALIRDAEGRCVGCGYRVGELETCPECGRKVRRRAGRDHASPRAGACGNEDG